VFRIVPKLQPWPTVSFLSKNEVILRLPSEYLDSSFCICSSVFAPFGLAFASTNVSLYNQSPLREQFAAIAANVQLEVNNPNYTMIGENIQVLRNAFSASKAAGKPWQIWAGATSKLLIFFV
jgi:hypothetical protein